jgi:hypothetical protein
MPSSPRPVAVSVVPPTPGFRDNALFNGRRNDAGSHSPNVHWMDGFAAAAQLAPRYGLRLATDDLLAPADADVVVQMSPPTSPKAMTAFRQAHPDTAAVLVLLETALGAAYQFNPANHRGFDAVITYDDRLVDHERYFPMRPRAYYCDRIRTGLAFDDRKIGCLVGTHRRLTHRTGLGAMYRGWRFSGRDWWDYFSCPGELITYRGAVGA